MMDEAVPELSILIASFNSRRTIESCLVSLCNQKTTRRFEIILVDSSTDGTAEFVSAHYPEVHLITSPTRLFCGDARNLGMCAARAPIIAFIDADCYVESGWVNRVLEAHRRPELLIGGVIQNGTPESAVAWAYYFCEFSLWLPRREAGPIREVAGCCLSFKREAFDRYGPFLTGTYSSDTVFHLRARADGQVVRQEPAIQVFHRTLYTAGEFLRHVAFHRRCYAKVQMKVRQLSKRQRLFRLLLTPILPFLLFGATGLRVMRSNSLHGQFFRSLPLVFAGLCARAWGECQGFAE